MSCINCNCNACKQSRIKDIEKKFDIEFETFAIFLFNDKYHAKDYQLIIDIANKATDRDNFLTLICKEIYVL